MPLDLVIPDLLLPQDAPAALRESRLAHAERWLARAAPVREKGTDAVGWIARHHGIADAPPVAAISRMGDTVDASGSWLRADPVHLRIENDGLVLHEPSILRLTMAEAAALTATLNAHFASDGLAFEALAPDRWYVRVPPGTAPPRTTPLREAAGRNFFGMLPKGGGFNWAGALTEAQMVLAAHPVNEQRHIAANSVWFWGEGAAPSSLPHRYEAIHSGDSFARGVARLSGARTESEPDGLESVQPTQDKEILVVIDALAAALGRGDAGAWLEAAKRVDAAWFAGVGAAIGRFGTIRVILPGERATLVSTLTPSSRWRWFRPRRPLAAHA